MNEQRHILFRKWSAWLKALRPVNLLMIAFFYALAYWSLVLPISKLTNQEPDLGIAHYTLLAIDVILVAIYGYLINDFYDQETDRVNKPDRLIPSGIGSPKDLLFVTNVIAVSGFIITLYLGFVSAKLQWTFLHPLCILLLYWYAKKGKRSGFMGNLLVSFLIAVFPFLILLSASNVFRLYHSNWPSRADHLLLTLGVFSGLMFTTNLLREVIKDIEDVRGDKLIGSKALIHIWSLKRLKFFLVIKIITVTVLQAILTNLFGLGVDTGIFFALVFVVTLILFFQMKNAQKPYDFKVSSKITKVLMLIGMLELILFARLV